MPSAAASSYRVTVSALAFGQLLCWAGLYYAFSSFVLPMQAALGWSQPALMGAFSCGLAAWGACSYLAGDAIDRGHGRIVLSAGAALAGIGFMLWSQVQSLPALYGVWALMGAAMAMTLYEPAFNVLTKRYPLDYKRAITVVTLAGGFASTLSFPAAAALVATIGWRDALLVIGVVLLVGVAPLHAWVLRGPSHVDLPAATFEQRNDTTMRGALRERSFWLIAASFTLYAFAVAAVWAHLMPILAHKGQSLSHAVAIAVWIGPAQVLGRFVHLAVGHRLGARTLGLVVMGAMPLALLLLALGTHTPALLAFAMLFGLGNGLVTIVRGHLVPEYYGRNHVGRIGGAMTAITVFARAAAPLSAAWLLLVLPGYRELLLLLAGVGAAALVALAMARQPVHSQAP
jgi:MFS family permease